MGAIVDALVNYNPSGFAIANQQREATLAGTQAQTAQTQQQTAGLAQQQAIIQRQLQDQDVIRRAYINTTGDPGEVRDYLIKNGISGAGYMGWQQHAYDLQTKAAQLSKEQRENEAAFHDQAGNIIDTLNGIQDAGQRSQAYAAELPRLQKLAPDVQWKDPAVLSGDDLKLYSGILGHASKVLEQTKTQAQIEQERAAAAASGAAANVSRAELGGKQAESTIKQAQAAALSGDQAALEGKVDAIIDPAKYPDLNKRVKGEISVLRSYGLGPDKIAEALGRGAQEIAAVERETNPDVLKARTAQAVATEQATAPIKRANAIAEAKALREGDNPALAGVPPAAAATAVNAASKLDADYIKAREATENMGKLLDLADASNVAAGANIPLVGVGAVNAINGIRRINSAEISQYGTAGSLLQKIQGKLQGWTEGQPIPASVRDDIRELHQQLGESAYRTYTSGLDSLNKRTGAKFGPTQDPPNIRTTIPTVTSQAEYDKLPKGAIYLEDGKKYRKP